MIHQTLAVAVLTLGFAGSASAATGPCGDQVTVDRSDNLSRISERCDVSERTILLANPGLDGSQDLRVGEMLHLDPVQHARETIGSTARDLAQGAQKGVESVTSSLKSSVTGFMDRNPGVKSKIADLGQEIGLTDGDTATSVSVSPQNPDAHAQVTLSADNLPQNGKLDIGIGTPGHAYEVVARATASAKGDVTTQVSLPEWLTSGSKAIFVITDPDGKTLARSQRIALN